MPEIIRLLIVDDEPLAHELLEKYCDSIKFVEVAGHCYDGVGTLNFLNDNNVDAILLDIQLPDFTGIELLETLKEKAPKIIFTTAYTEYALQSFDFDQVIDYINKPIRLPRFIKAIERLKYQMKLEASLAGTSEPVRKETKSELSHIMVREDKINYKLSIGNILYAQSWGNYLKLFLKNGDVRLIRKTISELEDDLKDSGFVRIHKSYLVNSENVEAIDGNQIVIDDMKLPTGRSYRLEAMKAIGGG